MLLILTWKEKINNHYSNTIMQYTAIFMHVKKDNFQMNIVFFYIFTQNINCRRTLEETKIKNIYPCEARFWGIEGV